LFQALEALDEELRSLGSRLVVAHGQPLEVFGRIFSEHDTVKSLSFETDTEPYARERDAKVTELCRQHDVNVLAEFGHTLYDPEHLLSLAGGTPPLTMASFQKLIARAGPPRAPLPPPTKPLPTLPQWSEQLDKGVPQLRDIPAYSDLEFTSSFKCGEKEALASLERFLEQRKRVLSFEKPKTDPTSLEPDTTALSPMLKLGSLSARLFYSRLKELYKSAGGKHTVAPVSLEGQLLWREFYYLCGYGLKNYAQMKGNPACKQIPWDTDANARERLNLWEAGKTGFPAVDAAMNQLRNEGWMHHLARHLVACFLTRGDLFVHWEWGRDVFERHLIDADWSLNNGNWQWLSCSCFFYQYFRVYSPVSFFRSRDKDGAFIRKWVPALSKMPAKYIYEPWKAPLKVQQHAGCIIGKDYPEPMIDHAQASTECKGRMAAAYKASKDSSAPPKKKMKIK
jgi:cryptochrome